MAGFATGLSDEDIADLAAFYAALDGLTTPSR
jgi:cytochrome c553